MDLFSPNKERDNYGARAKKNVSVYMPHRRATYSNRSNIFLLSRLMGIHLLRVIATA